MRPAVTGVATLCSLEERGDLRQYFIHDPVGQADHSVLVTHSFRVAKRAGVMIV